MIYAFTGHRPQRLGIGYSKEDSKLLYRFAREFLAEHRPEAAISGFALGWDQAVAHASIHEQIPVIAAVPFEGQESRWPQASQERYRILLKHASEIHVLSPGPYTPDAMLLRDRWMVDRVDRSGLVVSLFDGERRGGTWHTVQYAHQRKKQVHQLWAAWLEFKKRCGNFHPI